MSHAAADSPRDAVRGALRVFRHPRKWLALWFVMIAMVIAGSLMPARELPQAPFDGFDKIEHLLGYFILSAYAALLFGRLRARAYAAAALVAVGIGLEFAQALLTTSRQAELADAVFNAIGVLAGMAVAATPFADLLQRLDARLR